MRRTRPALIGWLTSASIVTPIIGAPAPALAAPGADEARAQALYDEGRTHYDRGDYDAALERWGEAYGLVSDAPENDHTRYQLLYAIASAHDRAYARDGDPSHLRKARDLLLKCQASAAEVYAGDDAGLAEEQKRVRGLLDRVVDEMVEGRPAEPMPESEPEPATPPTPEPEPTPAPTAAPAPAPAPAPSSPAPVDTGPDNGKALFGAGLGLIGVGTAGLGVMIAGMVMASGANDFSGLDPNALDRRADQIRRGRLGNGLGVGGGIAAGIMIPVGIALTVAGRQKLKTQSHQARRGGSIAAAISDEYVGLHWRGRF